MVMPFFPRPSRGDRSRPGHQNTAFDRHSGHGSSLFLQRRRPCPPSRIFLPFANRVRGDALRQRAVDDRGHRRNLSRSFFPVRAELHPPCVGSARGGRIAPVCMYRTDRSQMHRGTDEAAGKTPHQDLGRFERVNGGAARWHNSRLRPAGSFFILVRVCWPSIRHRRFHR